MVRKKATTGKKVKSVGNVESRLSDVVSGRTDIEKENIMLRVDARLLSKGREVFGRKLSKIFEAALEDALKMKTEKDNV
jgi:predicted ABC-class ATPase